jgi:gamma-glutamyl:cysteine ligase YbdK (ATP-grasp superfamily)
MFNSSHIHVGTVTDETLAIHLEADMIPYAAAFGALAANSPFANHRRGEYKSYRVRYDAHRCTTPSSVRTPSLSQAYWGADAGPKVFHHATFEVRIIDCVSSPGLLAEVATFVAAYVHARGRRVTRETPSAEQYERSMVNRWLAARHGLQATFLWDDGPRPVTEILSEMIDDCGLELEALGASRADLPTIDRMLRKRTCQADYLISLADRYPEPWQLGSAMTKSLRHWDAFDRYLEAAPALEPVAAPDRSAILAEHLAVVGEGTHFYNTRAAMHLPPPAADAILQELVADGRIALDTNRDGGMVLHRVPAPTAE